MRNILLGIAMLLALTTNAQICRFEKSDGQETATYFEAIDWYKQLDKKSSMLSVMKMGATDAGYPLHLVLVSSDGTFDPELWHKKGKIVILINNGIHPGESDGIDASMLLARDIIVKKNILPQNVAIAIIPVYNIGGCLNRNSYTRANQNGPVEYGFRGNAQNLDLNRDFTKCDSKEAQSFTEIFHFLKPDIFIDNHVSDGADFQHTMTLISTQYNKLGPNLGNWLRDEFEPGIYKSMQAKGWDMVPYVDFESTDLGKGMQMFMDPPRYSSGYAALFNTLSFMPETHMLKPYKQRVKSTYDLMRSFILISSNKSDEIIRNRAKANLEWQNMKQYPLAWTIDSSQYAQILFKGYQTNYTKSEATGLQKMYYDHNQPFERRINFFNTFSPNKMIDGAKAYVIPHGWQSVIDLLRKNDVKMHILEKDSMISVTSYKINDYKSYPKAYEKHHKNFSVKLTKDTSFHLFLKGDYLIFLNQRANRYLTEMLEPNGDDSFFAWNFFDAVLQQKEGYSNYRWEDIAAHEIKQDSMLAHNLKNRISSDPNFATDSNAILEFIYKNSRYSEKEYLRYPIYRIEY
jgi:hypothetical protein